MNFEEIHEEMQAIAATGLEEILILTGESRKKSDVQYIGEACRIARQYFKMVGLEVYPMNSEEYAYLHQCGADYVTVFRRLIILINMRPCIWPDIRESFLIGSTPRNGR